MLSKLKNKSSRPARTCFKGGFTLLEILLVIGIIAILAGIVIVAINPSKQLATVRNTQRKSDLKQIYNAITQYYIDNSSFPSTISTTTLNEVCNTGAVSNTSTSTNGANCATAGLANLSTLVPTYLVSIPTDPTGTSSLLSFIPTAYAATTATGTGYKVGINTSKQVLISAPLAELGVRVVVGNVPTTVVVAPLNISGLVAHYKMNDINGTTVLDNIGSNVGNGTYTATTGRVGGGVSFNGTTNFINLGNPANTRLQYFTMIAWVKLNGTSPQFFWSHSDITNSLYSWGMRFDTGFLWGGHDYVWDSLKYNTGNLNDGNWHQVGIYRNTADNRQGIIFDGQIITSTVYSATYSFGDLLLGKRQDGYGIMNGSMDDVRIYNRVLTLNEIIQLYNSTEGTEAE